MDRRASTALCLASAETVDGLELCAFEVRLHVIGETDFRTMFAARLLPTSEGSSPDPYINWRTLPEVHTQTASSKRDSGETQNDVFSVNLGPVRPEHCLGHFVDYPAYPVSVMARDAVSLVAKALRLSGVVDPQISVVGGSCTTTRFAFAGQQLTLRAQQIAEEGEHERWLVTLLADESECATFAMAVSVAAPAHKHSLIVGPSDDIDMLG